MVSVCYAKHWIGASKFVTFQSDSCLLSLEDLIRNDNNNNNNTNTGWLIPTVWNSYGRRTFSIES